MYNSLIKCKPWLLVSIESSKDVSIENQIISIENQSWQYQEQPRIEPKNDLLRVLSILLNPQFYCFPVSYVWWLKCLLRAGKETLFPSILKGNLNFLCLVIFPSIGFGFEILLLWFFFSHYLFMIKETVSVFPKLDVLLKWKQ